MLFFVGATPLFSQQKVRFTTLREYADLGNPDACVQLGVMLWNGDGVKQDRKEALSLLNKAADGGSANAYPVFRTFS